MSENKDVIKAITDSILADAFDFASDIVRVAKECLDNDNGNNYSDSNPHILTAHINAMLLYIKIKKPDVFYCESFLDSK